MVKSKKIKEKTYKSEEQQEILRFVKILFIVILIVIAVYFVTRLFVKKDLGTSTKETTVTKIDYNKMVFGTMLNKNNEEYYVLAFSSEANKANYYGALADKYSQSENALNIYFIDLEDSLNKDYVSSDGSSNSHAKTVSELSVGELTLIKVENGAIVKYLETVEDIKTELNIK